MRIATLPVSLPQTVSDVRNSYPEKMDFEPFLKIFREITRCEHRFKIAAIKTITDFLENFGRYAFCR